MNVQREWAIQRGVKFWVKRCIAVPHEFAAHDRGAPRSQREHIGEAARGIRRAWPDTELVLDGGCTFRCELKAPGVKLTEDGAQDALIARLNKLGHPTCWANSVQSYGEACERFGVPLLPNWRTVAKLADELVAADIRKQEARKAAAPPAPKPSSRPRRGTPAQIKALHAAGVWRP